MAVKHASLLLMTCMLKLHFGWESERFGGPWHRKDLSVPEGPPLKLARMFRIGSCRDRRVYLAVRVGSCRALFRVMWFRVVRVGIAAFGGRARHEGHETE